MGVKNGDGWEFFDPLGEFDLNNDGKYSEYEKSLLVGNCYESYLNSTKNDKPKYKKTEDLSEIEEKRIARLALKKRINNNPLLKKKMYLKKAIIIAIAALFGIGVILLLNVDNIKKEIRYQEALDYIEEENYFEATCRLVSSNYKHSENLYYYASALDEYKYNDIEMAKYYFEKVDTDYCERFSDDAKKFGEKLAKIPTPSHPYTGVYSYERTTTTTTTTTKANRYYGRSYYNDDDDDDDDDPYNAKDYDNEEDFYEDNYDDFFDYYDAEEYYDEYN